MRSKRVNLAMIGRRLGLVLLLMAIPMGAAFIFSRRVIPRWRGTAQLILVQRAATVTGSAQSAYAAPMVETASSQVVMIQSLSTAQRAIVSLRSRAPDSISRQYTAEVLHRNLSAWVPDNTSLINVAVTAGSPTEARMLTDAVCSAFVDWKQELARRNIQNTLLGLQARVSKAQSEMLDAERQEAAFKQRTQIVDAPAQQAAAVEQATRNEAQVASLAQQLASQRAHLVEIARQLRAINSAVAHGSGIRDDSLVVSLQQQLTQAEIERAEAGRKFTYRYPGMLPRMDGRIRDLRSRLEAAIHGIVQNNQPSLQERAAASAEYHRSQDAVATTQAALTAAVQRREQLRLQSRALPQKDMGFEQVSRKARDARALYASLQSSLNEIRTNLDLASGNVQVFQNASAPRQPYQPDVRRYLLYGALIGLALSSAALLILMQVGRRTKDLAALRRMMPGPVIGSLSILPGREARQLAEGQAPVEAIEAYNLTRANLQLSLREGLRDSPRRVARRESWEGYVVLITSAVPGEGKSITSAELARSMARSGSRVVLVDADMRRPTQQRLFHTPPSVGLAEVLAGSSSLAEALVTCETENLSILHSGAPERNPSELFSLPVIGALLLELKREADIVVVDTPPCGVVADALLLAPHADSVICVVGAGRMDEAMVRDTAAALGTAAGGPVSFFINQAPQEQNRDYKAYYYTSQPALPAGGRSRAVIEGEVVGRH